jgi:hypothetical protein
MPKIEESYLTKSPEEMGLDTTPVGAAMGGSGPAPEPNLQPQYSRFMVSPIPLVATYQPDALRQFYRGGIPQQRIFPRSG